MAAEGGPGDALLRIEAVRIVQTERLCAAAELDAVIGGLDDRDVVGDGGHGTGRRAFERDAGDEQCHDAGERHRCARPVE